MSTTDQESLCETPPPDRSLWRDTNIYASRNRDRLLGGLWAAEGITNANLYSMLEIICSFTDTFTLHDDSEHFVERNGQKLKPGNYYIATNGTIAITDEVALTRTSSMTSGTRVESFRQAVRERDGGCIATGRPAPLAHLGWWMNFETAHVFPLAYEKLWNDCNYSRFITDPPADPSHGTINSVQNGILLTREMHYAFDNYSWSINPDDNHKIVCFTPDLSYYGIAGRSLDQTFLDNNLRPPDQLLRWHFRQAVLTNVKGVGEPCFESDFPPGSDIMGAIMSGPKAGERLEFELFSRFNAMGYGN
ncbi:hypothetical protein B9Z19DRAFT_1035641 [Tuber borchii]|uniref:Uncharacterized protein n=1 Tax=Tuber borchii TaxID=42251 RepID=A0A2T6ZC31_TUBBO|nr:hypothetical protein B9Z19DRAFT_1035641 [Tuber borchii]